MIKQKKMSVQFKEQMQKRMSIDFWECHLTLHKALNGHSHTPRETIIYYLYNIYCTCLRNQGFCEVVDDLENLVALLI